jgi:hypothetical protein
MAAGNGYHRHLAYGGLDFSFALYKPQLQHWT